MDFPSVSATVRGNDGSGSQTWISLEHADDVGVIRNECSGHTVGIELHDSSGARVVKNWFDFTDLASGCE